METQESRYEIHYQLANTNKMPIIQARCENVQFVSDRKALNHQKSDLHQQQDRACLKMQSLKEILDNTLLLSLLNKKHQYGQFYKGANIFQPAFSSN